MSTPSKNAPTALRKREKQRSKILRGKGGDQSSTPIKVTNPAQPTEGEKRVRGGEMLTEQQRRGYALRGARKVLKISKRR